MSETELLILAAELNHADDTARERVANPETDDEGARYMREWARDAFSVAALGRS